MRCAGFIDLRAVAAASDLVAPALIRIGPDTTFRMPSRGCSRYLHPGDAPRMGEWPRQGSSPCRGPTLRPTRWDVVVLTKLLVRGGSAAHAGAMFVVTDAEAAAIRVVFEREGDVSATIEVRRLFLGVTDNVKARAHARTIAGWKPLPMPTSPVTRLHPEKGR